MERILILLLFLVTTLTFKQNAVRSEHATKYPIYFDKPKNRIIQKINNYYSPAHCFKSSIDSKTVLVSYKCDTLEEEGTYTSQAKNNKTTSLPFNIQWKYYSEYSSIALANTELCWTASTHHFIKQSNKF